MPVAHLTGYRATLGDGCISSIAISACPVVFVRAVQLLSSSDEHADISIILSYTLAFIQNCHTPELSSYFLYG